MYEIYDAALGQFMPEPFNDYYSTLGSLPDCWKDEFFSWEDLFWNFRVKADKWQRRVKSSQKIEAFRLEEERQWRNRVERRTFDYLMFAERELLGQKKQRPEQKSEMYWSRKNRKEYTDALVQERDRERSLERKTYGRLRPELNRASTNRKEKEVYRANERQRKALLRDEMRTEGSMICLERQEPQIVLTYLAQKIQGAAKACAVSCG